jgi:dihydrofolate reductase
MRKVIAGINVTIDGFCDHDVMIADDELHEHYSEALRHAEVLLYGRTTFQLMEYWRDVVKNPTGDKATDDFAVIMDNTPKIVFSRTLKNVDWQSAKLATKDIKEEVLELRQQEGKDIFVGSPSLIVALTQLGLIDEYQLCVHPVVVGSGLPLFKNIKEKIVLELLQTKKFGSGAMVLYYKVTGPKTTTR